MYTNYDCAAPAPRRSTHVTPPLRRPTCDERTYAHVCCGVSEWHRSWSGSWSWSWNTAVGVALGNTHPQRSGCVDRHREGGAKRGCALWSVPGRAWRRIMVDA